MHRRPRLRGPGLPHAEGPVGPRRDVETMETELILADHTIATRRAEKLEANIKKSGRDEDKKELEAVRKCIAALEKETPLRELDLSEEDERRLRGFTFLSAKPLLVVLNVSEADAGRIGGAVEAAGLTAFAAKRSVGVVPVSAKIEMEIARLSPDDAVAFQKDLGIEEPCLDRVIRTSYDLLGLISFFTVGEDECRAWTIRRGTNAQRRRGRSTRISSGVHPQRGGRRRSRDARSMAAKGSEAASRGRVRRPRRRRHFRFNI